MVVLKVAAVGCLPLRSAPRPSGAPRFFAGVLGWIGGTSSGSSVVEAMTPSPRFSLHGGGRVVETRGLGSSEGGGSMKSARRRRRGVVDATSAI